jgi:hypothetical protein
MGKLAPPNLQAVGDVTSAAMARGQAIGWQDWQSEQSLSMSEVSDWQSYFEALADKFPELKDEFKENAII